MSPSKVNHLCTDEDVGKNWISRSVAVVGLFDFVSKDMKHYALIVRRSEHAADNHGKWCLPCGYVDYNETCEQAIGREFCEETGIVTYPNRWELVNVNSDPYEHLQNISLIYRYKVYKSIQSFDSILVQPLPGYVPDPEISERRWIDINREIYDFEFAFNHDKIIKKYGNDKSV